VPDPPDVEVDTEATRALRMAPEELAKAERHLHGRAVGAALEQHGHRGDRNR
jgi:hypothetical protein